MRLHVNLLFGTFWLHALPLIWDYIWAALCQKVPNVLSRCHTKRRMGPSFSWYDTDFLDFFLKLLLCTLTPSSSGIKCPSPSCDVCEGVLCKCLCSSRGIEPGGGDSLSRRLAFIKLLFSTRIGLADLFCKCGKWTKIKMHTVGKNVDVWCYFHKKR